MPAIAALLRLATINKRMTTYLAIKAYCCTTNRLVRTRYT